MKNMKRQGACTVLDCGRTIHARGLCNLHYLRRRDHGSTDDPRPSLVERFWMKVNKDGPVCEYAPELGPCWVWTGSTNERGYATFSVGGRAGRPELAYRLAYEMEHGPVPEGLELDHLCSTHPCVRPAHLEPVTHSENMRRAYERGTRKPTRGPRR